MKGDFTPSGERLFKFGLKIYVAILGSGAGGSFEY